MTGWPLIVDFGGFVAVAAGDRERLAGGGRTRRMQRDFDVEDVVLDGGFHGLVGELLVFGFRREKDELVGLDPFGGLEDEAGDDRADADAGCNRREPR